ncbi:hypothetical protein BC829DRAFT_379035 [Chytridium lagenaria]|nr:hypothetical protein BC829DRAFT_379035 [Chytridium lagenaria]
MQQSMPSPPPPPAPVPPTHPASHDVHDGFAQSAHFTIKREEETVIFEFPDIAKPISTPTSSTIPIKTVVRSFLAVGSPMRFYPLPSLVNIVGRLRGLLFLIDQYNQVVSSTDSTDPFSLYVRHRSLDYLTVFGIQVVSPCAPILVPGLDDLLAALEDIHKQTWPLIRQTLKEGMVVFEHLGELFRPGQLVSGATTLGAERAGFLVLESYYEDKRTLFGKEQVFHLVLEFFMAMGVISCPFVLKKCFRGGRGFVQGLSAIYHTSHVKTLQPVFALRNAEGSAHCTVPRRHSYNARLGRSSCTVLLGGMCLFQAYRLSRSMKRRLTSSSCLKQGNGFLRISSKGKVGDPSFCCMDRRELSLNSFIDHFIMKWRRDWRMCCRCATEWSALVLLDEADSFLEKRTAHGDMVRNAMVCVMLRLIEYHRGILFLTTNRVRNFDPAVESRITVALRYDPLDHAARKRVWQMLVGNIEDGAVDREALDWDELAGHEMNGRQIKNAVRLGMALANYEGVKMDQKHLVETIAVTALGRQDIAEVADY